MENEIEPLMINYKYLEPRPHRWRKQLYIKGRNMTVWQLVSNMLTECYLPTEAAENYDLPLETIAEALLYCIDNWELIQGEREEEWEWLKAHGIIKEKRKMENEIEPLMINYKHLEPRPHRWREQLYIKGRNMTVWQLVSNMLTECYLPTEAAENYDLPLETIAEALLYCIDNWELIQTEREEEWQRLVAKGIIKEEK